MDSNLKSVQPRYMDLFWVKVPEGKNVLTYVMISGNVLSGVVVNHAPEIEFQADTLTNFAGKMIHEQKMSDGTVVKIFQVPKFGYPFVMELYRHAGQRESLAYILFPDLESAQHLLQNPETIFNPNPNL